MHPRARDLDGFLIEIDDKISRRDDRLGVAFRAPYNGLDARDKFVLVERLGQIVVGANPQALDLVLYRGEQTGPSLAQIEADSGAVHPITLPPRSIPRNGHA